ncbi:MAG: hypothetical protein EA370_03665 [Wenzhouxiangella sp.]|nr:MAG: hypothetical protein EA370_03665 [Wenzhouxiangella sp.]
MDNSRKLTVLMTWEMGGGQGHLVRLGAIGQGLDELGHRLVIASRDVAAARSRFPGWPCHPIPSPEPLPPPYPHAASLAEVLHNIGFDRRDTLNRLCEGWDRLAEEVRPDAVVMDFSPTALLAFQGHPVRRVLIDNGYSYPGLANPMPSLRPWQARYDDMQQRIESRLLRELNACLEQRGQNRLEFLAELYGRADAIHLMTVAELDHSGPKDQVDYRGYLSLGGDPPEWPQRPGHARLLVVLKPFAGIDRLLVGLLARGFDILAVIPGLDDRSLKALRPLPGLSLAEGWLDLRLAARQADGVLCAGGDTVGIVLLQGTPACVLAYFPEQRLTGLRAEATGAAVLVPQAASLKQMLDLVQRLIEDDQLSQQAARLALKYRDLDPQKELAAIVQSIIGHVR